MKIFNTVSCPVVLFMLLLIFSTCSSGDPEENSQQEQLQPQTQQQETDIPYNFRLEMETLLTRYLDLKNAMVTSNTTEAKQAAEKLSRFTHEVMADVLGSENRGLWMGIAQILRTESDKLTAAESSEEMLLYFENISTSVIRVADSFDPSGGPYYLMECAEAGIGDGRWISREKQIRNPYQTSADRSCGEILEEL